MHTAGGVNGLWPRVPAGTWGDCLDTWEFIFHIVIWPLCVTAEGGVDAVQCVSSVYQLNRTKQRPSQWVLRLHLCHMLTSYQGVARQFSHIDPCGLPRVMALSVFVLIARVDSLLFKVPSWVCNVFSVFS